MTNQSLEDTTLDQSQLKNVQSIDLKPYLTPSDGGTLASQPIPQKGTESLWIWILISIITFLRVMFFFQRRT